MTFMPGCARKTRSIASSALMVLPEPVGAPNKTLSSVWYRMWKACMQGQHLLSSHVSWCHQLSDQSCPATTHIDYPTNIALTDMVQACRRPA